MAVVIATLGVGWVYAVNALTFVCVIAALLMMRDVPSRDTREPSDVSLRAVRDGLGFVFSSPIIRSTMLLDFFATFFASATALLPIFAQDVLHVGARGLWLAVCGAVGRRDADERRDGADGGANRTTRASSFSGASWRMASQRLSSVSQHGSG